MIRWLAVLVVLVCGVATAQESGAVPITADTAADLVQLGYVQGEFTDFAWSETDTGALQFITNAPGELVPQIAIFTAGQYDQSASLVSLSMNTNEFALRYNFSPDGSHLAYVTYGNTPDLRVWALRSGEQLVDLPLLSRVTVMALSPDHTHVYYAYSPDGTADSTGLHVYNFVTGELVDVERSSARAVAFNKDGSQVLILAQRRIYLYDLETRRSRLFSIVPDYNRVTWSPDGKSIAAADFNTIHVYDFETREIMVEISPEPANASLSALVFNRDGTLIATAQGDFIRLYDAETGELLLDYERADSESITLDIAFSPDGTQLAFVNLYESIEILAVPYQGSAGRMGLCQGVAASL